MARKKLGEILVAAGVLDDKAVRAALGEQVRWGGPLGRHLIDMKLVREEVLIAGLSKQLGLPAVDLDRWSIPTSVVELFDADLAVRLSAVPFQFDGHIIDVAMGDPTNDGAIDEMQLITRHSVRPYIAGPKAIERALARYYGRGPAIAAMDFDSAEGGPMELVGGVELPGTTQSEIRALQERVSRLEALLSRDEDVLRKLMSLLIEKGYATREEIARRLR